MKRVIVFVANRLYLILGIYLATIVLASLAFAYLEARPISDGLWWAVVTSLTIGYGDITPITACGRIMATVFAHIWIFGIIPMVVANIIMRLIDDKNEFSDAEQKALFWKLDNIEKKLDGKRKRKYLRG